MSTPKKQVSSKTYIIGYLLSITFTLLAYLCTTEGLFTKSVIIIIIVSLAIAQLFVQLIFFLHMGEEKRPKWNIMAAIFATMVVFIVVAGTIWIMNNLNYHGMTPDETEMYLLEEEGIKPHYNNH